LKAWTALAAKRTRITRTAAETASTATVNGSKVDETLPIRYFSLVYTCDVTSLV
jgi:hypothetical protein